jgi:transglutaminase-like putative cysteine protease
MSAQSLISRDAERVTVDQLTWVCLCLALALLAGIDTPPLWVTITVVLAAAIRVGLAVRGADIPPRIFRVLISGVAIGLLFLHYRTFNGLTPGTALLTLISGLKLLETRTQRDIRVIVMIIYFLSLATLLEGESFWLLGYMMALCWLSTSTLMRLAGSSPGSDWRASLRYAGRLVIQALPLAAALWLFFPRFGGPLWQMPDDGSGATSGLSDTMSPGDITDLAASDEVAFRVRFGASTPPAEERYWRGPVLHEFDGRTWRRGDTESLAAAALSFQGPAYQYTVNLEPSSRNWLYVLDWPSHWNAPRAMLNSDYMLISASTVSQPIDVVATSYGHVRDEQPLSAAMRRRDTRLPPGRNPRSLLLARELRSTHPGELEYIDAVLAMFHSEPFFYTLKPPRLAADSVDDFLFATRRGFCGHYASAFAELMRAAGIPARVVTGYHGGTFNRFADYWIVRQSDAHAWDEVWIEGRGWVRIDPTAAIDPGRVNLGLKDAVGDGARAVPGWRQRTRWVTDIRLRLDALRLFWRERILQFDSSSQDRLLDALHIPSPDGQKLALVLAACLIVGMTWLTWSVRRELTAHPADPVVRSFARLCRRLSAIGIERLPGEGAEDFAARAARLRPDLAGRLTALCLQYSALRYGARPSGSSVSRFAATVRSFRPRAKP